MTAFGGATPIRIRLMHEMVYGVPEPDHDIWIAHYNAHIASVKSTIPASQLLILDVKSPTAMLEIADFLDEPHEACESAVMPKRNERQGHDENAEDRLAYYAAIEETPHRHQYAYVTVLPEVVSQSVLDALVESITSLKQTQPDADIVVLVYDHIESEAAEAALHSLEITVIESKLYVSPPNYFPRPPTDPDLRRRVWAWSLVRYKRVIFFDPATVRFQSNCDALFQTDRDFVGFKGTDSAPLTGDFFIATPSYQALADLTDFYEIFALWFQKYKRWLYGQWTPADFSWSFPRAGSDQGLYYFYFLLSKGLFRGTAEVRVPGALQGLVQLHQ